jgi:hypothetical protein
LPAESLALAIPAFGSIANTTIIVLPAEALTVLIVVVGARGFPVPADPMSTGVPMVASVLSTLRLRKQIISAVARRSAIMDLVSAVVFIVG